MNVQISPFGRNDLNSVEVRSAELKWEVIDTFVLCYERKANIYGMADPGGIGDYLGQFIYPDQAGTGMFFRRQFYCRFIAHCDHFYCIAACGHSEIKESEAASMGNTCHYRDHQ